MNNRVIQNYYPQPPNLGDFNKAAEDCINEISERKEYVSWYKIEEIFLQKYRVTTLHQLGLVNIRQLQCVQYQERLEALVNITIEGFIHRRSICTLYDLDRCILDILRSNTSAKSPINIPESYSSFEDLKLGPLNKLPVVVYMFQVSPEKPIFELKTGKLLTHLMDYLNRKHMWGVVVKLEEFMDFVRDMYELQTAEELGVRIPNFPIVIQTVKRLSKANSDCLKECMETCQAEITSTFEEAFRHFKHSIPALNFNGGGDDDDDTSDVQIVAETKNPIDIVRDVFSKLHYLYVKIQEYAETYAESQEVKRNMKQTMERIKSLRNFLQKDELIGKVFHIALCCSQDQIAQNIGEIFAIKETAASECNKPVSVLSKEQVVEKIKGCLQYCFENGPISLDKLSKIEERIVSEMQVSHFGDFTNQGFLAFIVGSEDTKKLLDDNEATSLGSSMASASGSYRTSADELNDFVRQCVRFGGSENAKHIKRAICHHYRTDNIKEAGCHGAKLNQFMNSKKDAHICNNVIYESALHGKGIREHIRRDRKIGLNGSMTREQALLCLHNCPLLHDLSEWSHWDLVFKPEHGDLKSFLRHNGGVQQVSSECDGTFAQTEVAALETGPGKLLKLRVTSSREDFETGVRSRDVLSTCGHLVSCLVNEGGAKYFSQELFANTLKNSLIEPRANESAEERDKSIACFVLECLLVLPTLTATSLVQKVFLEPMSEIVGNSRSKELLLEAANGDVTKINKLEYFGFTTGISSWYEKSFEKKFAFRQKVAVQSSNKEKKKKRKRKNSSESDEREIKNKVIILSDENERPLEDAKNVKPTSLIKSPTKENTPTQSIVNIKESSVDLDHSLIDASIDSIEDINPSAFNPGLKSHWRWLVEDIRRNEFGLGVGLEEDGKKLLMKQQDRLGRSLERLSVDLYSRDTHFLLELVQNADDNQYDSVGFSMPSLQFSLHKDIIIVLNNEVGFRDIDLRAICDVGRTTKGKHKLGYIGQKGIGFKSVFRICDRPEVHSRGLHIKFDLNSGPLGYILPHWIGSKGGTSAGREAVRDADYTTKLVLPLKKEEHTQGIQSKFQDLHPTLLLFLNRLRKITINDELKGEVRSMTRRDLDDNVTEIEHDRGVERWLFVKKVIDASEVSKEAKSGIEVQSTELAMAFPIEGEDKKEQRINHPLPPKQPLFAFLPLRSYGFRFIIHADFDVPSSREDVIDNLWNQWLRSKIHVLFLEALEHFKTKKDRDPVREICNFFRFVPREDEILDFFRQVALNIVTNLKVSKCLPSAGNVWCFPSQLIMCDDVSVRNFVTSELLFQQTGLDYLHPTVAKAVDHSVLLGVGVQLLSTKHLVQVGRGMLRNIHREVEENCQIFDVHINQIYAWLSCLYRSMEDLSVDSGDVIESLKVVSFIPLSSGHLVSMEHPSSIFFPFSSSSSFVGGNNQMSKKMIRLLEEDLNSVDSRMLLSSDDQVSRIHVFNILERMGVKKLADEDLVKYHILPSLKNKEKSKTLSKDLLIAYTICLKNYFSIHPSSFPTSEITKYLPIFTSKGIVKLQKSSVYFSTDFNNPLNLKQQLPVLKWSMLDSCYLSNSKTLSNVSVWREFFGHLGVRDFMSFRKQKVTLNKTNIMTSNWKSCAKLLDGDWESCTIEDWNCNEFNEIISSDHKDSSVQDQIKKLFELINKYWDDNNNNPALYVPNISQFTEATLKTGETSHTVPSTFAFHLKTSRWIPVWQLDVEEKKNLSITVPSKNIIADSRETILVLGSHAQYAAIKAKSLRKNFAEFVGIQIDLEPSYVVEQIKIWCLNSAEVAFQDSPTRMVQVYKYLEDSLSKKDLIKLAKEHPIIYCPKFVGGSFLFSREVCWEDESGLIEKYYNESRDNKMVPRVLSSIYPASKKDFFTRTCNVQSTPSTMAYAHILSQISFSNHADDSNSANVLKLLSVLEQHLSCSADDEEQRADKMTKIVEILQDKKFIPNKAGKWMSLQDRPILADDKQFERMFPSCANYINIGDVSKNKASEDSVKFLTRVGVRRLSELVKVRPVTEMFQLCPELGAHVTMVVPFIQRCLYFEFPSIYDQLVNQAKIGEKLSGMMFAKVEKLELVYQLNQNPASGDEQSRTAVLDKSCHIFDSVAYVQEDCLNNFHDINRELASYFSQLGRACPTQTTSCFNELKSLLSEITPLLIHSNEKLLNKALEERNILRLPLKEVPWTPKNVATTSNNSKLLNMPVSIKSELPPVTIAPQTADATARSRMNHTNDARAVWPVVENQAPVIGSYLPQSFPHLPNEALRFPPTAPIHMSNMQNSYPQIYHYPAPVSHEQLPPVEVELPMKMLRDDLELKVNNCPNPETSGMSGEVYVYNYFKKLAEAPDSDIAEVTHVNREGFTTAPYDLVIKRKSDGGTTFVEVKSTTLQEKNWFETSLPELMFATERGKDYHVYRVFGIGQDGSKIRLTKVENLKEVLATKQAKLAVIFGER